MLLDQSGVHFGDMFAHNPSRWSTFPSQFSAPFSTPFLDPFQDLLLEPFMSILNAARIPPTLLTISALGPARGHLRHEHNSKGPSWGRAPFGEMATSRAILGRDVAATKKKRGFQRKETGFPAKGDGIFRGWHPKRTPGGPTGPNPEKSTHVKLCKNK